MKKIINILYLSICFIACKTGKTENNKAVENITANYLASQVSEMRSDKFIVRQPFTEGKTITINYPAHELKSIGSEPAFSGSYFQDDSMIKIMYIVKEVILS